MSRTSAPGKSVSSRLLEVLFAFLPNQRSLTLADIERRTGLPHATARRLTLELVHAGLLDRGPDKRYTIGLRLWQLGTLAPQAESLRHIARPYLDDLYTALRHHVQLAVLEGTEAVIIERRSAPRALHLVSGLGGSIPLHASGVGKLLLAHADTEIIESVLRGELRRYTTQTVTNPDELRAELATCRRTGIAWVRGELTVRAHSVAARVLDSGGHVVAALSAVVDADLVNVNTIQSPVLASALAMSRALGWQPGVKARDVRTQKSVQ